MKIKKLQGRTITFQPDKTSRSLLSKWAKANLQVPWAAVINAALKAHLAAFIGKRES